MTPTLHAAAWAICETSGPRCEALCPGCLEQARAAGKVWLEAAAETARTVTFPFGNDLSFAEMLVIQGGKKTANNIAAAIEALIGETTA